MDHTTLLANVRQLETNPNAFQPDSPAMWIELLRACALRRELRACVLVYDAMVARKVPLVGEAFPILETVHSKTTAESNTLLLGPVDPTKLAAKRRIHKICKGHNYSESYKTACDKHLSTVTDYLDQHPELKTMHKDRLSKTLSRECKVPNKDAKYVITRLKRTGFLGVAT